MTLLRKIRFDPYFLEWLGRTFGKGEEEYLVCAECDRRYDNFYQHACECGGELRVHLSASEAMVIRWRVWKSDQKWWPQKYYVWPSRQEDGTREPRYSYWAWWGKEWFKREDTSEWWGDLDEHNSDS